MSRIRALISMHCAQNYMKLLRCLSADPNFLKMCFVKFNSKSECIKAKLFSSLGAILKKQKGGGQICSPLPV